LSVQEAVPTRMLSTVLISMYLICRTHDAEGVPRRRDQSGNLG
jgi:hypothetical protein